MTVKKLIQRKGNALWSVSTESSVWQALETMEIHNIGAVLILSPNGELKGIFSERDYARKGILKGRVASQTNITEVMTENVITVSLEDSLSNCMRIMTNKHIRHLPVQDEGKLVGMITIRDVVREIISDQHGKIQELEAYIQGSYGGGF
ncbi:MAG: CBS domain-containing protein [Bacteroidota bacterium]